MVLVLLLAPMASENMRPPTYALVLASISPAALTLGPFLFNPRAFSPASNLRDAAAWCRWLFDSTADGWLGRYTADCAKAHTVSLHAIILPQKELFLGFAT